MAAQRSTQIPVLTDVVARDEPDPEPGGTDVSREHGTAQRREALIAELQTELAAASVARMEQIMRRSFAEMESRIYEEISGRLRRELPELIDTLLRDRLEGSEEQD